MFTIRVDIVEWVDDAQPGLVASRLVDAWGCEHTLVDKVPIFTSADLDRLSVYPQPGWLACEVVERRRDAEGRDSITITTEQPWSVASTTGTTHFEVLSEQLIES
jgi:hypothetical protein